MKTSPLPLFLHSHSSGPKADSSPKISRGLGGLKSEFLKQSTARGLRTQDQPAGSKGRKVAAKGVMCVCACACGTVGVSPVGLHGSRGHVCVLGGVGACEGLGTLSVSGLEGPGT